MTSHFAAIITFFSHNKWSPHTKTSAVTAKSLLVIFQRLHNRILSTSLYHSAAIGTAQTPELLREAWARLHVPKVEEKLPILNWKAFIRHIWLQEIQCLFRVIEECSSPTALWLLSLGQCLSSIHNNRTISLQVQWILSIMRQSFRLTYTFTSTISCL